MTECPTCRGFLWVRFDHPDGARTDAPCWDCPIGLRYMGIGAEFHRARLADDAQHGPVLSRWRGALPGWLLYGEVGRGKTHLASAICRAQAARGRNPRFVTSARLLRAIKQTFDPETRREAREMLAGFEEADLVVLDDVGAELSTEWAEAELTLWIDGFYERGAALVVTTNLTLAQLTHRLGMRIASRITGMTRPLHLHGPDRRRGVSA